MTKSELKDIIHECVDEIIEEYKSDIEVAYAARRAKEINSNKAGHETFLNDDRRDYRRKLNYDNSKDYEEEFNNNGHLRGDHDIRHMIAMDHSNKIIDTSKNNRELYTGMGGKDLINHNGRFIYRTMNSNDRKRQRKND